MAVRKLAPEEIQPPSFAFTPENGAYADAVIAKYPAGRQASAVIPLLWRAQEQEGGWLPRAAIEAVAARLDMPKIRVMEIATFYTMFNLDPVGKYFIQFCGTTPCVLRGANDIRAVLERRIGGQQHVTPDGLFSWLEVECLGACCNAPMVQINDDYYEDLTIANFETLLDDLAAGRPVKAGSQIGRRSSEPLEDVKTLTDPALFDGSLIGAWRKRFEEEALKPVDTGEAAAQIASLPQDAKAAKPPSGRPTETDAADTPAKRVKEGDAPVKASERRDAGDSAKATAASGKAAGKAPAPQGEKSYTATPAKPEDGRPVAAPKKPRAKRGAKDDDTTA